MSHITKRGSEKIFIKNLIFKSRNEGVHTLQIIKMNLWIRAVMMENRNTNGWNLNVWPYGFLPNGEDVVAENGPRVPLLSQAVIDYQTFAVGFFGFHYIRAVNEDVPAVQRESLHILKKLLLAFHLNAEIFIELNCPQKQSYADFWDKILRKVALALGDMWGSQVQERVKWGFWLAAVHACFVGVVKENPSEEIRANLKMLESLISGLLLLAPRAGISGIMQKQMNLLKVLLRDTKTPSVAFQGMHNTGWILKTAFS